MCLFFVSRLILTKSSWFLYFLVDMPWLLPWSFPFSLIRCLKCSTIILFYLKFGFCYVISIWIIIFVLIDDEKFWTLIDFIALNNIIFWKIMKWCMILYSFDFMIYMFWGLTQVGCPNGITLALSITNLGFGLW